MLINGYVNNKKVKMSDPSQKIASKSMITGGYSEEDISSRERKGTLKL